MLYGISLRSLRQMLSQAASQRYHSGVHLPVAGSIGGTSMLGIGGGFGVIVGMLFP
jgi:hypothetical protein